MDPRATTKFDLDLGRAIRKTRLGVGMSQEKLAARLEVTFQQVQKYENGVNRISAARFFDTAEALQVDPMTLAYEALKGRHAARGSKAQRR